jgi:thioredoxin 1
VSTAVSPLTAATFDEEIKGSSVPVVVEFWATWCPPCLAMAPMLASFAAEHFERFRVFKIDADAHPEMARRYEVMSVPTFLVFDQGELRRRMVGARTRHQLLEDLGAAIGSGAGDREWGQRCVGSHGLCVTRHRLSLPVTIAGSALQLRGPQRCVPGSE